MTAVLETSPAPHRTLAPSVARMLLSRTSYEAKNFIRDPTSVFFSFFFPVFLLVIFAAGFGKADPIGPPGALIDYTHFYVPGLVTSALVMPTLMQLTVNLAVDRTEGRQKRLAGTPLTKTAYLGGKIVFTLVLVALQLALLLAVAHFVYRVPMPSDAALWARFIAIALASTLALSALAIALSSLPRSSQSASAIATPLALLLQFLSGVYLPWNMLPESITRVADIFPIAWAAKGMRSVFYPADWEQIELSGSWQLNQVAFWIGAWALVGLVVAVLTFRWRRAG